MRPLVLVAAAIALLPVAAAAQPTKPVAVTLGYPAAIGVLWHLNDRLAVRPDVTLNRSETKTTLTTTTSSLFGGGLSTTTTTSTQTDTTWSTGVSLLVTLADLDDLRLYLVPRVSYLRAETSSEATTPGLSGLGSFDSTNDGVTVLGGFGAHYMLGTRAALFAESGVQYLRQSFSSGIAGASGTKSTVTSVGLRSAVGFAVYF